MSVLNNNSPTTLLTCLLFFFFFCLLLLLSLPPLVRVKARKVERANIIRIRLEWNLLGYERKGK